MYEKDWEVYLALNNPLDPIHGIIDAQLEEPCPSKPAPAVVNPKDSCIAQDASDPDQD
jgi:hypothetical protein